MTMRRVSKVPHSCTTYHRRRKSSKNRRPSSEEQISDNLDATLTMIEEKSKSVLSPAEHSLLQDTVANYAAGKTPIARLLSVAAQVLNSPDKLSLLTELREVLRPDDLDHFDSKVFSQSSLLSIEREEMYSVGADSDAITPEFDDFNKLIRSFHLNLEESLEKNELALTPKHFTTERNFSEYVKAPSEDSGVDSNNERVIRRKKKLTQQKERKRIKSVKENECNLLGNFDNDVVLLIKEPNKNTINTTVKHRKVFRKKFSDKSDEGHEDFLDKYQSRGASPVLHMGSQSDYEEECHDSYFSHPLLEDLEMPPYSGGSGLPRPQSKQSSYFSHLAPILAPSSYSHRFTTELVGATAAPLCSSHPNVTPFLHSPIYGASASSSREQSPPLFSPSPTKSASAPQLCEFGETSGEDFICNTARNHQRHPLVDFGTHSHRAFSNTPFGTSPDGRDQLGFPSEHRETIRPAPHIYPERHFLHRHHHHPLQLTEEHNSLPSLSISQPQQDAQSQPKPPQMPQQLTLNQSPSPHPKGEAYGQANVVKSTNVGRGLYSRSHRMELTPSGGFQDLQEESEFFDDIPSPSQLKDHRQVFQNGLTPYTQAPSKPPANHLSTHTCPTPCGRRTSMVMSDSRGRFHVIVKKTKSNLGIAIEGGINTKHHLPRVINIAANGAAFEAGGLRVGQLILAVDGLGLEGKAHEEAARLIADAWTNRNKSELEFLVVDRKPSEADLRRNSISLLSQVS